MYQVPVINTIRINDATCKASGLYQRLQRHQSRESAAEEIENDGACFFRSLCKFLPKYNYTNTYKNALSYRLEIVQEIRKNYHLYGNFILPSDLEFYCENLKDPKEFLTGDVEIVAACNLFYIEITRYSTSLLSVLKNFPTATSLFTHPVPRDTASPRS